MRPRRYELVRLILDPGCRFNDPARMGRADSLESALTLLAAHKRVVLSYGGDIVTDQTRVAFTYGGMRYFIRREQPCQ